MKCLLGRRLNAMISLLRHLIVGVKRFESLAWPPNIWISNTFGMVPSYYAPLGPASLGILGLL